MGTFLGEPLILPERSPVFPANLHLSFSSMAPDLLGQAGGWGLPTPVQQLSVGVQNREGLMCGRMEQALYHAGLDQQI